MSRTSTTYRESCVIPPGIPTGPGSPDPGDGSGGPGGPNGGTGSTGTCGPLNPNDPTDPTNADCTDPTFAAANPSICGNPISLVLSPSIASIPVAGTQQYSVYLTQGGNNITVTQGLTFTSSDNAVASITSSGGLATGVTEGTVIISVAWHGYIGSAQLTVSTASGGGGPPGGPLCDGVTADFVILIDNSLSMSVNNRLSIAKQAASGLITSMALGSGNCRVAIAYFDGTPNTTTSAWTQSPWSTDTATLLSAISTIPQTNFTTQILGAYALSFGGFAGSSATYKSLVILSDGAWSDDASSGVSASHLLNVTTVCGGIYASGAGFTNLQHSATPGYFYNLSTGSGSLCTTPSCLYQALSQFPSQVCSGVVWGYALPASPVPSTVIPDPETPTSGGGGGTPPTTYTETASFTAQCSGNTVGDPVTKTASYTSSISQADAQSKAQAAAQAAATAALSCCGNQITINDAANASPFPACYDISGFTGSVTNLSVTLDDFTHSASGDVYVVVVNPAGIACQLLAGNGGITSPAVPVTLTFAPGEATLPVHDYASPGLTSGTYAPVQLPSGQLLTGCLFPLLGGAVSSFGALDISGVGSSDPNGTWKLYVCDNSGLNAGYIGSWFVTINGINACDCVTAPATLHVHGAAGGNLASVTCTGAGASAHTAWDGTGLNQSGSQCIWTTGIRSSTNAINGKILYSATVSLQNSGGVCYYELDILTATSTGSPISTWRGYKAGAFESGPAGIYNYAPLPGFNFGAPGSPFSPNLLCSPGPSTIQLDAM